MLRFDLQRFADSDVGGSVQRLFQYKPILRGGGGYNLIYYPCHKEYYVTDGYGGSDTPSQYYELTEYGTSPVPVKYNETSNYWEILPYHAIYYNGLTLTNNNVTIDPSRDLNRSYKIEVYNKQSWLNGYDFEIYTHYNYDPSSIYESRKIFTITNIDKEDKSFVVNINSGNSMGREYVMHIAMLFFNSFNRFCYLATATSTSCWD